MILSSSNDAITLLELYREKELWEAGDMGPGLALLSVLCSLGHVDGSSAFRI